MNIPRSLAVGRAVLGAMGACVVLGSTVGIANAGGDAIRACVNKSSGAIKIVHAGTACATNQTLLVWNQSGPPGPAGPQGPQGPQGVQGPSGVTDIQVVWSYEMFPGTQVSRAFCPPNTRVTGGGGFSLNGAGLKYSYPIQADGTNASGTNAVAWQVAATDWSDVYAFVACASQ